MCVKNIVSVCILFFLLGGCVKAPPANPNNICHIFNQYPGWARATKDVERRWHVPVPVQLAIIYQESGFNGKAQPPRRKLLWIIPWRRPTSAYGYSQALDGTWAQYRHADGSLLSFRRSFADSADFIGWYANQAYLKARIPRNNAYILYLAYHEGVGGYQRKTYLKKPWLMQVARKVEARSRVYGEQLKRCYR